MRSSRFLAAAAVLALAVGLSSCGDEGAGGPIRSNSYLGSKPPALALAGTTWLNAEGDPGLDKYLGKVVFLEFGFLR